MAETLSATPAAPCCRVLFLLLATIVPLGVRGEGPEPVAKKLIEFGWDEPETAFLRQARPGLANPFFAMATGTVDAEHATAAAQAALLKELGYAGTDHLGLEGLADKVQAVDQAGLKLFTVYTGVTIDAEPRYEPGLKAALELLRGRGTLVWLHLEQKNLKPSAPEGGPQAISVLREIADLAAASGLRVALYPHTGSWLERVDDALGLVRKVDRKNLGVTFNLCHWLRVEGGGDPRPLLERAFPALFAVTINGADVGGKDWKTLIQTLDRGTFDAGTFLSVLDRLGYRGPVGLQGYGIGGSVRENLGRSMDAWRRLGAQIAAAKRPVLEVGRERGAMAREALQRARGVLRGWWAHRDERSGLLPRRLDQPVWAPQDNAADMLPFLYLAARFAEPARLEDVFSLFRTEVALTTRLGPLPDWYSLRDGRFEHPGADLKRIIFQAAEYAKDGLLPLTEILGPGLWLDRMQDLIDGIFERAPIASDFGPLPADDGEVNGDILQVLGRLHSLTRDVRYLDWAVRLGDAYLLEAVPRGGGLPPARWDFSAHRVIDDRLSLNDHGNEILGGLAELFLAVKTHRPAKAAEYEPVLRRLFDLLLAKGRNEDGLWYSLLRASSGEVLQRETPDTWGYALTAVYTLGLATGDSRYVEAASAALGRIDQEKYRHWVGADSYADSIEGALLLLNRVPDREKDVLPWLQVVLERFYAHQQPDGVVEAWYGDGNFARTALMVALYAARGAWLDGWRDDVRIGGAEDGKDLVLVLRADQPWSGRLRLDRPRHRDFLRLPVNYPRLNELPEWYTVESTRLYQVTVGRADPVLRLGAELIDGMPIAIEKPGEDLEVRVAPVDGPPYGKEDAFERASLDRLIKEVIAETVGSAEASHRENGTAMVESRERWSARRTTLLEKLRAALGFDPWPQRTPLRSRMLGEATCQGYRIQRVVFESRPGFPVTANVYVPDDRRHAERNGRLPAVVSPVGHWRYSKAEAVVQARCAFLARRGFLVLVYDPFGQGERDVPGNEHGEYFRAAPAGLINLSFMVWDTIRGIDYLLERGDVDPERVGCTGASGGGLNTLYAAALDERIRAAVPVVYLTSLKAFLETRIDHCPCSHVPGMVRFADMGDILALLAPRPVLLMAARADELFTIAGARAARDEALPAYVALGSEKLLRLEEFDGPHDYSRPMREAMVGWLEQHLLQSGDGSPVPEPPFTPEPPDSPALRCFAGGKIPAEAVTVSSFARAEARRLVAALSSGAGAAATAAARTRAALLQVLGVDSANPARDPASVELVPRAQPGFVFVSREGQRGAASSALFGALRKAGLGPAALDLPGWGATRGREHLLNTDSLLLGEPMLARRARALAASVGNAAVVTDGPEAGLTALIAKAIEPGLGPLAIRGLPASLVDLLDRGPQPEVAVFGLLKVADIPQLLQLAGDRVKLFSDQVEPAAIVEWLSRVERPGGGQ